MARYASSDWHGNLKIAEKVFEFLKPEDELFFLGDAVDRGPDGIKIMNMLLRDKRVTYFKGNHEDMLSICVPELIEGHNHNMFWWCANGGDLTWQGLEHCSDDSKMWYVHKINQMPKIMYMDNSEGKHLILSHAGTDPWFTEEDLRLMGRKDPYIWDRKHIHGGMWDEEYKDTYVIHGHTPVLSHYFMGYEPDTEVPEYPEPEVKCYANGHKFCIDMATFVTDQTVLFNLDTFEAIKIKA